MNCTVIIPIGPGHMELGQVAMASVVAAIEADKGAFEEIFVVCGDDTKGEIGRSAARNRMVAQHEQWMGVFGENPTPEKAFETEWLFFLDADDLMCSPKVFGESAFSVVAPYLEKHDCIWGTIFEIDKEGAITKRTQRERISKYETYVKSPAPLTCQMGHFVRRKAFEEIGGFNEELDVCEDVDLYLREWKNLRCIKQEKPLFLNRRGFHSWTFVGEGSERKRHTGRDWSMMAEKMLKEARKGL